MSGRRQHPDAPALYKLLADALCACGDSFTTRDGGAMVGLGPDGRLACERCSKVETIVYVRES